MKCSFTYSVNNEEHWGVGDKQCGHLNVLISGGGSIQFQVLTLLSAQPWVYLLASLLLPPAFKQSFPFPSWLQCHGLWEDKTGNCNADLFAVVFVLLVFTCENLGEEVGKEKKKYK